MSQNIKKKLISIQIKMAQDKQDGESRPYALLASPIDSGVSCLMRCRGPSKEFGKRALRNLLNRLRMRTAASADISPPDPCYKVVYLGNVLTGWAKGENCVEKPLSTLWRNYTQSSRADVRMQLVVSGGGLRATTREHGLTEYWANRISFCAAPATFPRLFCWVYRHEGRRLRHELRCHAVLCSSASVARKLSMQLKASLSQALAEFKRDKISRQNARLSLVNSCYENPSMPRRKILLSTGSHNYRPPLERSKSAPKLTMIEENLVEEEDDDVFDVTHKFSSPTKVAPHLRNLRHSDSTSVLLDKNFKSRLQFPKKDLASRLPSLHTKWQEDCSEGCVNDSFNDNLPDSRLNTDEDSKDTPNNTNYQPFSKRNYSLRKCKNRSSNRTLKNVKIDNSKCEDAESDNEQFELSELTIELGNIGPDSERIIEELLAESINSQNLDIKMDEHCEGRMWLDSDEGSLSSGCESAGTAVSDFDQLTQTPTEESADSFSTELMDLLTPETPEKHVGFKLGGCVLARVRSLERLSACNNGIRTFQNYITDSDDVSLIPVGEMSNDFSSLRIFKKKLESTSEQSPSDEDDTCTREEEENISSCSDESGYVELLEPNQEHKVVIA